MNTIFNVTEYIEKNKDMFTNISDMIWDIAEPRFKEYKSMEVLCKKLEAEEFEITSPVAGMETAFVASYGKGAPVIAILGEYDALYNMSQVADVFEQKAKEENGTGHGCGHHALGTAALAAALAVKEYIKNSGVSGTIKYYGCPAEEGGSGKTFMVREGAFDGVDAALTWHPNSQTGTLNISTLANIQALFKFKGQSSHAAFAPHLGRSALDAVELMNIGANFLREHIIPEARLHYAITNTGGNSPNVVQANSEVLYLIRAPKLSQVSDIFKRVEDIAKGAALMTGTQVEMVFDRATSNVVPNVTLGRVLHENLKKVGAIEYTEEELAFAKKMQRSLVPESADEKDLLMAIKKAESMKPSMLTDFETPMAKDLMPLIEAPLVMPASTDVGDVSCVVPTAQFAVACYALGTPEHSWQLVAQGKSSVFHKGMLQAGKVLALAAVDLLERPEVIEKAWEEHLSKTAGEGYSSPIPRDVVPPSLR